MESTRPKVFVTDAVDYLGAHVTNCLLSSGKYEIKAMVKKGHMDRMIQAFPDKIEKEIEIIEGKIDDKEKLIEAVSGCDYLIHTAGPQPFGRCKQKDRLKKIFEDMTNTVLEAGRINKCKKIIIAGSVETMIDRSDKSKQVFTANDWANASKCNETVMARLQAELAAWEYIQNLSDRPFSLIFLNSGILVGPRLNEGKFFSSDFLKVVLTGTLPGLPNITIPFVDVRDAAKAFVMALEKDEANDKRFVLSAIDLKME